MSCGVPRYDKGCRAWYKRTLLSRSLSSPKPGLWDPDACSEDEGCARHRGERPPRFPAWGHFMRKVQEPEQAERQHDQACPAQPGRDNRCSMLASPWLMAMRARQMSPKGIRE